jgi:ionotropic glutamate receptor
MEEMNSNAWSFLKPLMVGMQGASVAFFLFVGAVVWILEHHVNSEFCGSPSR